MSSSRSRICPVAGIAIALLLAPAAPLLGQEPAPDESFAESIDVSVVNLDVFVTDRKGQPLTGLKREDFEVYEDSKPVEITNFYAESGVASAGAAQSPGAPAASETPAVRPPEQQLRLVIFVDDVNTAPAGRGRILDRLQTFLRSELRPGDQVMLVRYAHTLEIRREFTSDLARIEADVAELRRQSADLGSRDSTRDNAAEQIAEALEAMGGWQTAIESPIRNYAEREAQRLSAALDALGSVVSWLGGVSGRKAILYVSDGLPLVPGDDVWQWAAIRSAAMRSWSGGRISGLEGQTYDATRRFRELTAQASRNRVTIYPIEGGGTQEVRGTLIREIMVQNHQNGLRFLAQDTGGRAMLNVGEPLAALRLMSEDLTTYYSLGYQPQRPGDAAEHKIEVKVKVKGAQVRHRQWYRDKPVGESIAERTLAVMRFGPEDNPLDARLEIGTGKEQGDSVLVPVRVKVPIAKLYLQPGEGKRSGRLRLYVVASGEGTTTPVKQTKLVTLEVPESDVSAVAKKEYTHEIEISLKKGTYALGIGVRDELAATTSYLRKDFVLGEAPAGK